MRPTDQLLFDLQPYLPCRIWQFSWLLTAGPIQVASTLEDHFAAVAASCQEHSPDFCQILKASEEFSQPFAWLTCSRNRAQLSFLSGAPGVPKRSQGNVFPIRHHGSLIYILEGFKKLTEISLSAS